MDSLYESQKECNKKFLHVDFKGLRKDILIIAWSTLVDDSDREYRAQRAKEKREVFFCGLKMRERIRAEDLPLESVCVCWSHHSPHQVCYHRNHMADG